MPENGRRFWRGRRISVPEMVVGAALDHLTKDQDRQNNVPIDPTLPAELQGIIKRTDYKITKRGHHTDCWIWQKSSRMVADPFAKRRNYVEQVIYRLYSGETLPRNNVIQHRCGQEDCINFEHFSVIRQAEGDVIHRVKARREVAIGKTQRDIIAKLSQRYDWTEREQGLVFRVSLRQLRENYGDDLADRNQATLPEPDPDDPNIIDLEIPPEPDRPLPEHPTRPEPETPPARLTSPSAPAARKSKTTAALLALLLGGIGAHKFYLGYTSTGLIHLGLSLTVIGALVNVPVCIVEFLIYLSKSDEEFHQTYVANKRRFF